MKIIINADDYGMSDRVNEAIEKLFEMQLLDRCSIMMNMPGASDLARKAIKDGHFHHRIGLHVNLTEGIPLTDGIKHTFFCNDKGMMTSDNVTFYRRLRIKRRDIIRIRDEIDAQMKLFISLGLPLRHLDSHNYSSADWSILKVMLYEAERNGFTSIRLAKNIKSVENHGIKLIYRRLANYYLEPFNSKYNSMECTKYFGSIVDVCNLISKKTHIEGKIELMIHPIVDDSGIIVDHYTSEELVKSLLRIRSVVNASKLDIV